MKTTREDRKRAATFYFMSWGITGGMQDWIDSGRTAPGYSIDLGVIDLAKQFAEIRRKTAEQCAKACESVPEWRGSKATEALAAACRKVGES